MPQPPIHHSFVPQCRTCATTGQRLPGPDQAASVARPHRSIHPTGLYEGSCRSQDSGRSRRYGMVNKCPLWICHGMQGLTTSRECTDVQSKELMGSLQASPASLAFEPRVIHTSSRTAELRALDPNVISDPQLVQAPRTYAASKYLATLMMVHLDRLYGSPSGDKQSPRPVRCVNVDPGSVRTNVMDEGFKAEGSGLAIYIAIMRWGYWLAFAFVRTKYRIVA